jgi:dihydrofolate reductase
MKVTLYNAISIDGFIATPDGNSDWVNEADIPYFEKEIERCGCIIIGRKTFDQYEGELYPLKGITNIVMTTNPERERKYKDLIFTDKSPGDVLKMVKELGFEEVLLVGGGTTNASFLDAGLIGEIIVDVHPLVLGEGIKLFESKSQLTEFELVSTKSIDNGLVILTYKKKVN